MGEEEKKDEPAEDRTDDVESPGDPGEPTEQDSATTAEPEEPAAAQAEPTEGEKRILQATIGLAAKVTQMEKRLKVIEGGKGKDGEQQPFHTPAAGKGRKVAGIIILVIVLLIFIALPLILMWRAHKSEQRVLEAVGEVGDAVLEIGP